MIVYRAVIAFGIALFRALGLRRETPGDEVLPSAGGAVLAISHFGYLDFALTEWAVWRRRRRLVRFLATSAAFRHPVSGPLMRAMRHVPVDRSRGADAYGAGVQALRAGELVGVFPEGRVSRSFTLLPFKTGAARMAVEASVPLLPVVVWGGHRVITRGRRPSLNQARRTAVTIAFGTPLHPTADSDPAEVTARLRDSMVAMLARIQSDYPDVAPPGAWWQPAHLGGGAPTPELAARLDARTTSDRRREAAA